MGTTNRCSNPQSRGWFKASWDVNTDS
jgi:hypothetical protein